MASVRCPRCDSYTANSPIVVLKKVQPDNRAYIPLDAYYAIEVEGISVVRCGACERKFVVAGQQAVWPLASPSSPNGVPDKVREAYEDARLAYAAGAKIAALMAARTALIRFQRDKGVENFKELADRQIITPAIYGAVDQLRLWAAVAGHDDIDVDTFDDKEVEGILDYLATALEQAYTHQARVNQLVQRTEELKDKR